MNGQEPFDYPGAYASTDAAEKFFDSKAAPDKHDTESTKIEAKDEPMEPASTAADTPTTPEDDKKSASPEDRPPRRIHRTGGN